MANDALLFGIWLKMRRKQYCWTETELARHSNCAVITICKIEADKRCPSTQLAELLANELHVPMQLRAAFMEFARTGRLPQPSWLLEVDRQGQQESDVLVTPQMTTYISPVPFPIQATSAYLLDAHSGRVLIDIRGHLRLPIASTTKIMKT